MLPTEDADISKLAERGLKKQGIQVFTETLVEGVEPQTTRSRSPTAAQAGEAD